MAKIKKTRTITAIESGNKQTLFVIEMNDGTSWYTTKGGHVAFQTEQKLKSYVNIDNVSDIDLFTFYGYSADDSAGIDMMSKFIGLIRNH